MDSQNVKFPGNKHPGSRIGISQTGPKSMLLKIRIHNLAFKLATLPENGFGHTNFSRRSWLKAQKKILVAEMTK